MRRIHAAKVTLAAVFAFGLAVSCKSSEHPSEPAAARADAADADRLVNVTTAPRSARDAFDALTMQLAEPIGLVATTPSPTLGLTQGDLVVAINGEAVVDRYRPRFYSRAQSPLYLDVVRSGKPITIRVTIKPDKPTHEATLDRDALTELVTRLRSDDEVARALFSPVTKDGMASGLLVRESFLLSDANERGDIIRKLDGAAVETPEQLVAALDNAKTHDQIVLELDRRGRPLVVTLKLQEPRHAQVWSGDDGPEPLPDPAVTQVIAKIVRHSDTAFDVPSKAIDSVLANPMAFAKGARVVPALNGGKPVGFKLYAIRPTSIFAALGFADGDTITTVNGLEIAAADKAREIYTQLRDTKTFKVAITRGGKPLMIVITLTDVAPK